MSVYNTYTDVHVCIVLRAVYVCLCAYTLLCICLYMNIGLFI